MGFLQIIFLQERVRSQNNLMGKGSRTQAVQKTNQRKEIFLFSKTLRLPVGPTELFMQWVPGFLRQN